MPVLHVLQLFCAEELVFLNVSISQAVMFRDFCHTCSDSFLNGSQAIDTAGQHA